MSYMRFGFITCSLAALALSCLLLASCHKGGGGGDGGGAMFGYAGSYANGHKLTPEEILQAQLDPNNRDIPPGVVPTTFQGKPLQKVEVKIEADANDALGMDSRSITLTLLPGNAGTDGTLTEGSTNRTLSVQTWSGESSGWGAAAVESLLVDGTSGSDSVSILMRKVRIGSKTIEGNVTTFTGKAASGGYCMLGAIPFIVFSDVDRNAKISLIYHVSDPENPDN